MWVFYPLTIFIKRNKNLWVFGGKYNKYNDNVKYMFEHVSVKEPSIDAIWITGSRKLKNDLILKGFKAKMRYSYTGLITASRAGAYVYSFEPNDINLWLRKGAFLMNLWHGVGPKKIGIDVTHGLNKILYQPKGFFQNVLTRLHSPQMLDRSFYMLATSKAMVDIFSRSFQIPTNHFVIAGYPRLLPFYNKTEISDKWKDYNEIFLYMPTFRDSIPTFLSEAIPSPDELNEKCKKLNALFLLKLHHMTPKEEEERFKDYSNLVVLDNKMDVYPIMTHTTALITDYSSVFVDYAVLKKPIIIYTYDYEDYIKNSRELHFDFDELTQRKKITDFYKFLDALGKVEKNKISGNHLLDIFWERDSKNASSEITLWMKQKLKIIK